MPRVGLVRSRVVVGAAVGAAVLLGLAGCAPAGLVGGNSGSPSPSGSPTSPPPSVPPVVTPSPGVTTASDPLEIFCDENLELHASSETVTATSAGVPLLVSSEAPAGSYLTSDFGGDALPTAPELWTYTMAPGALTLTCWDPETDVSGAPLEILIVDPAGYWQEATLEDFGCPRGAIPSWAIGDATGATEEEAVTNLVAKFNELHPERPYTRFEPAHIGYVDQEPQTWLVGTAYGPQLTALVYGTGSSFRAGPDGMCQGGTWTTDA